MHIAIEHLIPKAAGEEWSEAGAAHYQPIRRCRTRLSADYTREAGVRQLERKIGEICRKAAREILEEKKNRIRVDRE